MSKFISKNYFINKITKSYVTYLVKKRTYHFSDDMLIGLGNPLLDITVTVDKEYLKKYGLKANDAILAQEKHMPIYNEIIEKFKPVQFTAGGSVTNALRVFAWMVQCPKTVNFFGCVGKDHFAEILQREAHASGVNTHFAHIEKVPTGTCAALITGKNRSFVANLGAANKFDHVHLLKPEINQLMDCAKFYYIEGFFVTVSLPAIMILAKKAMEHNTAMMFNLSAVFLTVDFHKQLCEILKYVDVLFGNAEEYQSFAKVKGWKTTDLREIGKKVVSFEKANKKRTRVVVITCDLDPIIVVQHRCTKEYTVPMIKDIVDTTGAGDAFAGGFISQFVQCQSIDICVRAGLYAAKHVLRHVGCTLEGKPTFDPTKNRCFG